MFKPRQRRAFAYLFPTSSVLEQAPWDRSDDPCFSRPDGITHTLLDSGSGPSAMVLILLRAARSTLRCTLPVALRRTLFLVYSMFHHATHAGASCLYRVTE